MRVIAGKYKGRVLVPLDGDRVRPTTDKVKESIFGSIQFDVVDSVFVDLFAGSGAMGIEALSRGAEKVIFGDNSLASIDIIKSNIAKIKLDASDNYEVINRDYRSLLSALNCKVDIIFVDPPYKDKPLDDILDIVIDKDLLCSDGKIIYEHLSSDGESKVREGFYVDKYKKYGSIAVEVIRLR